MNMITLRFKTIAIFAVLLLLSTTSFTATANEQSAQQRVSKPSPSSLASSLSSSLSAPSTPYNWGAYLNKVGAEVKRNWRAAQQENTQRLQIRFEVDSDGFVHNPHISISSGDTAQDNSALQAIAQSAPFSSYPDTFNTGKLVLQLDFVDRVRYAMHGSSGVASSPMRPYFTAFGASLPNFYIWQWAPKAPNKIRR